MRFIATAVACLGLVLVVLVPSAAGAKVRHCSYSNGHGPTNDRSVPLGKVTTNNMVCSKALRAISSGRLTRSGNLKTDGFSCKVTKSFRPPGEMSAIGADVSCSAGPRSFSFSWAT